MSISILLLLTNSASCPFYAHCRKESSGGRRSFSVFLLLFAAEGIINSSLSFHLHGISFDRLLNQHFFSPSIISWLTITICLVVFTAVMRHFWMNFLLSSYFISFFYCGIDSSMRLHWNCVTFLGVHKYSVDKGFSLGFSK